MSVYVVMRDMGESICGVFTRKTNAVRMANALGGYCEEYELNPKLPPEAIAGNNFYDVALWRGGELNGTVMCVDFMERKTGYRLFGHSDPQWKVLGVNVWAKTPQEAIDYAQALRLKLIAEGKWG